MKEGKNSFVGENGMIRIGKVTLYVSEPLHVPISVTPAKQMSDSYSPFLTRSLPFRLRFFPFHLLRL